MLLKDILKAKQEGEAVDIKGVKLGTVRTNQRGSLWWTDDDKLRMSLQMVFDLSSVEGKSFYDNVDVPEVSLSTKPKYDPCRRLRKGDKVRIVEWNGRKSMRDGMIALVVNNEDNGGMVEVSIDGWKNGVFYHACKLELVTPVEELEPYRVETGGYYVEELNNAWVVRKNEEADTYSTQSWYCKKRHPHAKAAAEDERDRLNAEYYRKEQE